MRDSTYIVTRRFLLFPSLHTPRQNPEMCWMFLASLYLMTLCHYFTSFCIWLRILYSVIFSTSKVSAALTLSRHIFWFGEEVDERSGELQTIYLFVKRHDFVILTCHGRGGFTYPILSLNGCMLEVWYLAVFLLFRGKLLFWDFLEMAAVLPWKTNWNNLS